MNKKLVFEKKKKLLEYVTSLCLLTISSYGIIANASNQIEKLQLISNKLNSGCIKRANTKAVG